MKINNDIQASLKVLRDGGIILYPTDTIWGIGCDATNAAAVSKIYALKKRNEEKSMIILLENEKDIVKYSDQEQLTIFDYIKGIENPVTIIYNEAKNLAENLINKDGSIGIRVVKDNFCRQLIHEFGKPVVSTSSNVSGYPPPVFFNDIDIKIKNGVDYIVQHRQDDDVPGRPSTVIKLNEDGSFIIIRP